MNWILDEWKGCYPSSWKGVIVPEAMSHPAKFSSKLIRKIYEHMKAEGWLKEGDVVLDPFGGVALGALDAMRLGLRWRGIELEARFADLGAHNISNWNVKYSRMPHWCSDAHLLNGDSRKLLQVLQGQNGEGVVSSPPYADGAQHTGGNDPHPEKMEGGKYHGVGISGAISSPPYAESQINPGNIGNEIKKRWGTDQAIANHDRDGYGSTDGQLGAMKAGNFDAAISSPPFEERSADGGWQMLGKYAAEGKLTVKQVKGNGSKIYPSWDQDRDTSYGETEGQMGKMKTTDEGFAAAISSPPFRHSEGGTPEPKPGGSIDKALYARHAAGNSAAEGYGGTDGQLANMAEGDFQGAVSRPPYNLPMSQEHNGKRGGKRGTTPPDGDPNAFVKYGNTPGQLEGMKDDGFDAAVSSPPFEDSLGSEAGHQDVRGELLTIGKDPDGQYGTTDGQLGGESGDDFWMASRAIVEQVFQALAPGGHAAWVVKGFVKNKEYVDFPDQWRRLCEAVGFVTVHEHRAMLVHSKGKTTNFDGEEIEHKTESKSFFRRLAEKKGSPRVDWETVWCMVKPGEVVE